MTGFPYNLTANNHNLILSYFLCGTDSIVFGFVWCLQLLNAPDCYGTCQLCLLILSHFFHLLSCWQSVSLIWYVCNRQGWNLTTKIIKSQNPDVDVCRCGGWGGFWRRVKLLCPIGSNLLFPRIRNHERVDIRFAPLIFQTFGNIFFEINFSNYIAISKLCICCHLFSCLRKH